MKQRLEGKPGGNLRSFLLAGVLFIGCAGNPVLAREVYTWTDENGVKHFSDMPRPQGEETVIEAPEAYKPGSVAVQPPDPEAGDVSIAQARREAIAQQRAATREAQAVNRQACADAREELERLEPARRVFAVNEAGESVRLDDDQRMGLIDDLKRFLAENCSD